MNWSSELAIVWLPRNRQAYPEDFVSRATPGHSDFYYSALDGFEAVYRQLDQRPDEEPWAFNLAEARVLPPSEIANLRGEWQTQFDEALGGGGETSSSSAPP